MSTLPATPAPSRIGPHHTTRGDRCRLCREPFKPAHPGDCLCPTHQREFNRYALAFPNFTVEVYLCLHTA